MDVIVMKSASFFVWNFYYDNCYSNQCVFVESASTCPQEKKCSHWIDSHEGPLPN